MASSWEASLKAMVFLQPGHGMLKPPRIFLKCSHRTGFGSTKMPQGPSGTRSEQSMPHRLVDPLVALSDSGLRLFGLTALHLGQHRGDQPIELTLTGTACAVRR